MTLRASSSKPGFSHLHGVLERDRSMLRKRNDLLSVGGVGTIGRYLSVEYSGGGDNIDEDLFSWVSGADGASRDGGGGGAWMDASKPCRGDTCDGCVPLRTYSVGSRDDFDRCDPGRRLSSFMRLVDSVRRNCCVKSAAQLSGNGVGICCGCGGTGLRRGTP